MWGLVCQVWHSLLDPEIPASSERVKRGALTEPLFCNRPCLSCLSRSTVAEDKGSCIETSVSALAASALTVGDGGRQPRYSHIARTALIDLAYLLG
jgi:hypothetical protein